MRPPMPVLATLLAAAVPGAVAVAAPAAAAQTPSAVLSCTDGTTTTVTGFGRGTPLKLVGSTSNYVVKYAETDGRVLLDVPAPDGRSLATCTATSPLSGATFTFRGFFTPARA